MQNSMGKSLKNLIAENSPVQVLGVINAYSAMLAEQSGAKAIYISGAGVANSSYGLPDLGITSLNDVLEDVRRIRQASSLPVLVDVDTGFGGMFNIARTVSLMEQAGVAAIHIEDQVAEKRCGHRPNKAIVSKSEMGDRIKSAVDARKDENFIIMARTDAYAKYGMDEALDRAAYFVELGADMIFPEALTTLDEYRNFTGVLNAPVLANITEFGKTPMFTIDELKSVGVSLALYPLSAFRAMSKAALNVYTTIINEGTQDSVVDTMQTRDELYEVLGYCQFESQLDKLLEEKNGE
ncbi:MAG: methylisocitrate lyase [Legionellaceae bacterium]|nr:methylisocitrate lyase [Legionellaceae bacterium]